MGEPPSLDPSTGSTDYQRHTRRLLRKQTLDVCDRQRALSAEPSPDCLLAARHAQQLAPESGPERPYGLPRPRAHDYQAEVLGFELVVELGRVDRRTGEQPLHTLY